MNLFDKTLFIGLAMLNWTKKQKILYLTEVGRCRLLKSILWNRKMDRRKRRSQGLNESSDEYMIVK